MYVDEWRHLLEALNAWGTAVETAPGRIAVTRPDGRAATIVMTPFEYDEMLSIMALTPARGVEHVLQVLQALHPEERFAVYSDYRLDPSVTETLPDLLEDLPPPGSGHWLTHDHQGREIWFPQLPDR